MNPMRLVLSIVVVFIATFGSDFLIHGVWLQDTYKETATLWRPESEMAKYSAWLFLGQFIFAIAFVVLWAQGFAAKACLRCACLYGLFMGLFSQAGTFIWYAVSPLPSALAIK